MCSYVFFFFVCVFFLEEFITDPFEATDTMASRKTVFLCILINKGNKTPVKEGSLSLVVYCFHLLHHQLESLLQNI